MLSFEGLCGDSNRMLESSRVSQRDLINEDFALKRQILLDFPKEALPPGFINPFKNDSYVRARRWFSDEQVLQRLAFIDGALMLRKAKRSLLTDDLILAALRQAVPANTAFHTLSDVLEVPIDIEETKAWLDYENTYRCIQKTNWRNHRECAFQNA